MRLLRTQLAALLLLAGAYGKQPPSEPSPPKPAPPDAADQRVNELIARIDDKPDLLHSDYTPAVHDLIKIGRPALLPALELMLSGQEHTRLRAQRVIEGVTMNEHGFVFGQGWKVANGEENWKKQWAELGDLDCEGSLARRKESVALWKKWLAGHEQK